MPPRENGQAVIALLRREVETSGKYLERLAKRREMADSRYQTQRHA